MRPAGQGIGGQENSLGGDGVERRHPQTLVFQEHRDKDNQTLEQGSEENGGGEEVPDGVRGGSGLREPLRAPEPRRTPHPPPPRAKIPPETPPIWRAPSLPLPLLTADHRELWFRVGQGPGAQFSTSCLRHRLAGTSGAAQVSPAKEVSNAAPLGLYHSGAPPIGA